MPAWDPYNYEPYDDGEPQDDLDARARTRSRVDHLQRESRERTYVANQSHRKRLTALLRRHNAAIDPPPDPVTGYRVTDETRALMGAAPYRAPLPEFAPRTNDEAFDQEDASYGDEEKREGLPAGNAGEGQNPEGNQGRA